MFLCRLDWSQSCEKGWFSLSEHLHIFSKHEGKCKNQERKKTVQTKPTSICFLERVTPAREGAWPCVMTNADTVNAAFCAHSSFFHIYCHRHRPSKHSHLSGSGARLLTLWRIAVKKLKCFCSRNLLSKADREIVERIPSEDVNTGKDRSAKKLVLSTQVCCGRMEEPVTGEST